MDEPVRLLVYVFVIIVLAIFLLRLVNGSV
jgi:hypothetical protein